MTKHKLPQDGSINKPLQWQVQCTLLASCSKISIQQTPLGCGVIAASQCESEVDKFDASA